MKQFNVIPVDRSMQGAIQEKIDNLNKPKGSLGRLEELAMQVCLVQQTLEPSLAHPCHLLLGGDHGIEREGVSVSPREVTWQQMINFTRGGGGVNMFCRQHGFKLRIVDVGVDYDFSGVSGMIDRKIARGTKNFLYEPAMSEEEFDRAIQIGSDLVDDCMAEGCRVLSIGEMGIGNTSPSSIWMSLFGDIPLKDCIGAGAGLNNDYPASQDYMIFTHCGDEAGHKMMLDIVDAKPLLHFGLRLGEGTGALCAYPLVDSAVRMMNEMNNFEKAQITKYF